MTHAVGTPASQIVREPGPVKGGKTVIAFAEDPTGYKWELIERAQTKEPLAQVSEPMLPMSTRRCPALYMTMNLTPTYLGCM